jgi:Cu/Ag efflux pump CusA
VVQLKTSQGELVRLDQVAEIRVVRDPIIINREQAHRRCVPSFATDYCGTALRHLPQRAADVPDPVHRAARSGGGIAALWLRGINLNLSGCVGFIALFGVAVLNGVVMVTPNLRDYPRPGAMRGVI